MKTKILLFLLCILICGIIIFNFKKIKYIYYINGFSEKYWTCYINGEIWSKYNRFSYYNKYEIYQNWFSDDSLNKTNDGTFIYNFDKDSLQFFGWDRIHSIKSDTIKLLSGPGRVIKRVDTLILVNIAKPKNISKKELIRLDL